MVDLHRKYRRWLAVRLAFVSASMAVTGTICAVVLLWTDGAMWLKVLCGSIIALVLTILANILIQTWTCGRLHFTTRRREARYLRLQLRATRAVAGGGVILGLVFLIFASVFQTEDGTEPLSQRRFKMPDTPVEPVAEPKPPAPDVGEEPVATKEIPNTTHSSVAMEIEEPLPDPELPEVSDEMPDLPVTKLSDPDHDPGQEKQDPFDFSEEPLTEEPKFRRLVALADNELELPHPDAELGVLLLEMNSNRKGSGAYLEFSAPIAKNATFELEYLYSNLTGDGDGYTSTEDLWMRWHRLTAETEFKLMGFETDSRFDVSLGVGLSMEVFRFDEALSIDRSLRASPHISLSAAWWETEVFAVEVHVAQSIPFNLVGSSSQVTDASGSIRIDLSEAVSLRLGLRVLVVRLKDYPHKLETGSGEVEFEEMLTGPFLSLEMRF